MLKALANKIIAKFTNTRLFFSICKNNQLKLSYKLNIKQINILKEVFVDQIYSKHLPKFANAVIVDVGAHLGYFSLYAAKNCNRSAQIIALEPASSNRKKYQLNILANKVKNTILLPFGISDSNETKYLYYHKNIANHSLINKTNKKKEVDLITISELIKVKKINTIDFLKMDCEGAEYQTLLNCPIVTLDKIKCISLEFHDIKSDSLNGETLKNFLIQNGFKISTFEYNKSNQNLNFGKLIAIK